MIDHYVPRRRNEPAFPPIAHNTAATIYQTGEPTNEANQLEMVEATAQRGCEAFWLDAYWYPQPWHEHVGDWFPRPDDFPNGLKPVSTAAHEQGMRFVLWFEPERVVPGTQWGREHPEFLLRLPDATNRLINLGDPGARAFVTDFLDGRIREWGVDVYRQDFNMDPLPYWRVNDREDRQGITEMKYVEGLYRLWDELVVRNPALTIDNCSSGGRRIDLETCSRSYPLWRSDYNDIGQGLKGEVHWPNMGQADQVHVAGLNLYVPFHTGPVWDERPCVWRSAMAAGIALYGNVEGFDQDTSAAAVAELKSLRPFFLGDFFPLTEVTTAQQRWHAYQLDRPDLGAGFAVFFRRPECTEPTVEVELRGINPATAYEVSITGETYENGPWLATPGAELKCFAVTIPEQPGSALVRYRLK
jgi:alpha-galactosidase